MKIKRGTLGISTTILCLMVVFSLLFLPWVLRKIPMGRQQQQVAEKKIIETETVKTPDISVYRSQTGSVATLNLEDYVKGVVSGEMPSTFEEEALKAQAVAARTYALSKVQSWQQGRKSTAHPGAPLCDTTHCQVYRTTDELEKLKSAAWMKSEWNKIVKAADQTAGQVLYYQGALVDQPLFHSSSGGATENSEAVFASAVPYLRSVSSTNEEGATHQNEATTMTFSELSRKLQGKYPSKKTGTLSSSNIKVLEHSDGGRVEKVQVGSSTFSGRQVREALGLSSANFKVNTGDGTVTFVTVGYGHGVGMSQYGANGMAKDGADYKTILTHYYSGVTVEALK